jgi:hypothetical protein
LSISGGTLKLENGASIASSSIRLGAGSVFDVSSVSEFVLGSNQTLRGSGTVRGNPSIAGTLSPGASPGLMTIDGNLSMASGSTVVWDLADNSVGTRGTQFDGVDVSGNLAFAATVSFQVVLNGTGSSVQFSSGFWNTSRLGDNGWLVYDSTGSGTTSGVENIQVTVSADSTGAAFTQGLFFLKQVGNDVYLNYAANPSMTLTAGGGQAVSKGTALPTAPSVTVKDGTDVLSGVRVSFAITAGGGSIAQILAATNGSGVASGGVWTLGSTAGTNTLSAAVAGAGTTLSVSVSATGFDGPYVFEIPGVVKLTVSRYGTLTQSSGTDPFAVAQDAVLELGQFSGLGPITLSQVSLYGTASEVSGFEVTGLTVSTSGYLGSATYKFLDVSALTLNVANLKATKASGNWSLNSAAISLSAASATLLPNEADLTASIIGFSASINVTAGNYTAAGAVKWNLKGAVMASGSVAVSRSTQTGVTLGGLSGSTPLEVFTVDRRDRRNIPG